MFHALASFGSLEPLTASCSRACNENVICIRFQGFLPSLPKLRPTIKGDKQPRPSNLIAKSRSNSNSTRNLSMFETATEKLFRARRLNIQLATKEQIPCLGPADQFPCRRNRIFRGCKRTFVAPLFLIYTTMEMSFFHIANSEVFESCKAFIASSFFPKHFCSFQSFPPSSRSFQYSLLPVELHILFNKLESSKTTIRDH